MPNPTTNTQSGRPGTITDTTISRSATTSRHSPTTSAIRLPRHFARKSALTEPRAAVTHTSSTMSETATSSMP